MRPLAVVARHRAIMQYNNGSATNVLYSNYTARVWSTAVQLRNASSPGSIETWDRETKKEGNNNNWNWKKTETKKKTQSSPDIHELNRGQGDVKKSITSSFFNRITFHLAVRCRTFQEIDP